MLCVSALPLLLFLHSLSLFFFLLFHLRSPSEGLTISSSVSLLSCSAVYCLWFAQAHPCGCSFQQPSVTRWIEGDPRRFLAALGHTRFPLTWDAHTLITLTCWWNLNPCLAAGARHRDHRDITWEEKERYMCFLLVFTSLTLQHPGVPSCLLCSPRRATGSQNTHWERR